MEPQKKVKAAKIGRRLSARVGDYFKPKPKAVTPAGVDRHPPKIDDPASVEPLENPTSEPAVAPETTTGESAKLVEAAPAVWQIENLQVDLKREREEFSKLRQEYIEADHERHRLKDNLRDLHSELQEAKALSEKEQDEIENLKMELKRERGESRHLRQAYLEADHERHGLKDNLRSLQHELEDVRREFQEAKAVSEIKGKEVLGTQAFLSQDDSPSISDVVDKANILNEEISQAAASLGETLVHVKRNLSQEETSHSYNHASMIIGDLMVELLQEQAQRLEINIHIVQAALSIFLVGFCVSKLGSWHSDKYINTFLGTLYSDIRASEKQAVSGRWRALTYSKIRPTSENWKLELTENLTSVFVIAGWGSRNSEESQGASEQKFSPMFKAVEDLRIALGEKFATADLEVSVARTRAQFDSQGMKTLYGGRRQAAGEQVTDEIVVGTLGIGLKKVVTEPGGQEMFDNFLSPKVILHSTLRDALGQLPSQKNRMNEAHLDGRGD